MWTHCFEFVRQVLTDSLNFKRKSLNYIVDGIESIYHCDIDGKYYKITIKPIVTV